VMPCLNEAETVGICVSKALGAIRRMGIAGEVVVVDNGSTDGSQSIAEREGARVVQEAKRGYGNALLRGFAEARANYVIFADSDDSYDLSDLERYLDRLRGGADLVIGTRRKGVRLPGAMPPLNRVGNWFFAQLVRVLFGPGVSDVHSGMRAFTKQAYRRMALTAPGMELASEIVVNAKLAQLRIVEIPITQSPAGRSRAPHLRPFRDGWRHLHLILNRYLGRRAALKRIRAAGRDHL